MFTDITIWNPRTTPGAYAVRAVVAAHSDVTGQSRKDDYAEADYVPVKSYLKVARSAGRAAGRAQPAPVDIVATAAARSAIDSGRAQAAIQLYASIFNYPDQPTGQLSVRV